MMSGREQSAWHQMEAEAAARELQTDLKQGLSATEVEERQNRHGPNQLSARKQRSWVWRLLEQFRQPLMYILVIAGGVTAFLGEYLDSSVIFGVVIANAVVGFLQESKAEKAINALSELVVTNSRVLRDGKSLEVNSVELVPGEVVLLQSGDKVPADLRLFEVRNLQADESALTGESAPVQKSDEPVPEDTILAERTCNGYAGTLVTYGKGKGVVFAIGESTETGRIAQLIEGTTDLSTPLTRKIAQFTRLLLWVILGLGLITFIIGVARGQSYLDMFMAAVALAVGAIPEGLPAAVTITLAIGVQRMAGRRAIIRKLPAVETLGSTTVICSDKTGTLTQNQMTVQKILAGNVLYDVSGTGYAPEGKITRDDQPVTIEKETALEECLRAGVLNNDSQIKEEEDRLIAQGDPTEAALLVAGQKAGIARQDLEKTHSRIDLLPFESEHQYMATLHRSPDGDSHSVIYMKGAVERVVARCSTMLTNDGSTAPIDRDAIRQSADELAGRGLRVLSFARRQAGSGQSEVNHDDVREGLEFLGLQAMIDPPRPEAVESIRKCHKAGIAVKMITGDHRLTATAIAGQLGLGEEIESTTGQDLEGVNDEELPGIVERTQVFARVAPEQKLRLVQALQTEGEVVAMTGDGVNDAPALKQADIGVAMGITGTEVAKGAADMLLMDDNFSSIEAAVEEGRGVFDNLSKFIVWTIPTNAGEALLLMTAVFFGSALPALPVHLLWINMTTAILLGLMLVFEPKEQELMLRPPRDPKASILTTPLLMRSGLVSLLILVSAYSLFAYEQAVLGASIEKARTVVINVIIFVELAYLFNCRSLLKTPWSIGFFSNRFLFIGVGAMIAVQFLFSQTALFNRIFRTEALNGASWLRIVLVALGVFVIVEIEKWIRRIRATGEESSGAL